MRAFDCDTNTYFASEGPAGEGDTLTVSIGAAQKITSVTILTGRPDGRDVLASGTLEVSADGTTFDTVGAIANGRAEWSCEPRSTKAIRLRVGAGVTNPLVVREIIPRDAALEGCVVAAPGRASFGALKLRCDFSKVPPHQAVRLRDEFDRIAGWYFGSYEEIVRLIDAPTNGLARELEVRFSNDMKPGVPGYASGNVMTISVPHLLRDPYDLRGLFVHELTHVAQAYHGVGPGWMVEGLADAVRYRLSAADDPWRKRQDAIPPAKVDYHNAYGEAARFLLWIEGQGHPGLIAKLSRAMKERRDGAAELKSLTGRDADAWLADFRAAPRS